ncbi:hypothetical protein VF_A0636 [Aliivibrio fischeri ES114]|uniref:Uncharacterized protein n=1 Tax=Aliivibrio fischeri (strain ATCC 700601 / ES114) TaxID=312309 RepID=Q5DZU0_ALIF1|nr:hypothetical protein [Aliivibrio fischeri]AAW87706.1 hypothetical protein VF_A0636 [Aliivibrio fischeri ES114]KLU78143.1 hypothetical protein AB192_13280 [Aliivibrio fischeri]
MSSKKEMYIIDGKNYKLHAAYNDEWPPISDGEYVVIIKDLFSGAEVAYHSTNPTNANQVLNMKVSFEQDAFDFYSPESSQLVAISYRKSQLLSV